MYETAKKKDRQVPFGLEEQSKEEAVDSERCPPDWQDGIHQVIW